MTVALLGDVVFTTLVFTVPGDRLDAHPVPLAFVGTLVAVEAATGVVA